MADAKAWGAPQEFIDALQAEDVLFAVAPENWPTICAWSLISTQWRVGPGGAYGLDYPAVFATLDRCHVADPDGSIFRGLQLMEGAAVTEMHRGK